MKSWQTGAAAVAALALWWWVGGTGSDADGWRQARALNASFQDALDAVLKRVQQAPASDFAWLNDAQTAFIVREQTPMPLCDIQDVVPQIDSSDGGKRLLLSTTDPAGDGVGSHTHTDAQGVTHHTKAVPLFEAALFGRCGFIAEEVFLDKRNWVIVLLERGVH